jgi:hypothetical protein
LIVPLLLLRTLVIRYDQDIIFKKHVIILLQFSPVELISLLVFCQLLVYGRRIPIPELFARIDAVDASTVRHVANRFIFDQVLSIL